MTEETKIEEPKVEETVEVPEVKEEVKEEPKVEETKVEEPVKDAEPDELPNSDKRFGDVILDVNDGTINAVVSEGNVLSALGVDQLPLLASTRANVGITSGRYLFEIEVMQHTNTSEVRLGFSLRESSQFLGDKNTIGISSYTGQFHIDGAIGKTYKSRRFTKGDVIGLLLNRTEEGNKNTVSVFINGKRHSEPQTIPESFDGALFPHITVRGGAVVAANFGKTLFKQLPFTCRSVGDVSKDHVVESKIKPCQDAEVTLAMGFQNEEWEQQHQMSNPDTKFVLISQPFIHEWMEKSSIKRQALNDEALRSLFKLICSRNRQYIWTLGHHLLVDDRKRFCERIAPSVKKNVVIQDSAIEKLHRNLKFYKDVTIPTEEEGWNTVTFTKNAQSAQAVLENWQKACKNQTKVEDFKATDKLKEKITAWNKFRVATEKDAIKKKKEAEIALKLAAGEEVPEEKEEVKKEEVKKEGEEEEVAPSSINTMEWTPEDWMLAGLRMELHTLCHAFKEDVEDKERETFSADFLAHYHKLYSPPGHAFHHSTYAARNVAEVMDLIKDTIVLEQNMLIVQLEKNEGFDTFIQNTELAREERLNLIGAGDEGAKLKFKAQVKPKPNPNQNKGGKGFIRPGQNKGAVMKGGKPQQAQPQFSRAGPLGPAAGKGAGKGPSTIHKGGPTGYALRSIPGAAPAAGIKRPGGPDSAPAAKRIIR